MRDNLLISTWKQVFVRYADGDACRGSTRQVADKNPPYYGLTWNEDNLFVGARNWEGEQEILLVYDKDFRLLETQALPTGGSLHQLLWYAGGILICDTPNDRVIHYDPTSGEIMAQWRLNWELGQDKFHLNSVWAKDGRLFITSLHGKVWTVRLGGMGVNGLASFGGEWAEYPYELHNFFAENGTAYVGASNAESLLVHDFQHDTQRLVNLTQHLGVTQSPTDLRQCYTRGLARSADYFYVGAAAVQDERNERSAGNSALAVFDSELNFVEGMHFEDTGGMHDVRVLGKDSAHNGIDW